ncbi:hypothetical protein ACIHQR_20395 [Corallococcus coralloides]|uniref:hypothetical protein n=1 Tax=Corallococcus coralloides TaxID=184914 RepID=UPI00384D8D32
MTNPRKLALALVFGIGASLLAAACSVVSGQDNFVCGVRVEGDAVARCDAPNERCICSDMRCALPEPEKCPESGWRYSFPLKDTGDGPECVAPDATNNYVLANSSEPLCPGEREAEQGCGVLGADGNPLRCAGANSFCLCTVRRCAEPAPQCADAGFSARFVTSRECVGELPPDAGDLRERPDGTCFGARVEDLFPDAGGAPDGGSDAGGTTDAG